MFDLHFKNEHNKAAAKKALRARANHGEDRALPSSMAEIVDDLIELIPGQPGLSISVDAYGDVPEDDEQMKLRGAKIHVMIEAHVERKADA